MSNNNDALTTTTTTTAAANHNLNLNNINNTTTTTTTTNSTPTPGANSPSEPQRGPRNTFTNDERQAIRDYYYFSGLTVSQSEVRTWFQQKYSREVSQPVVSRILSDKYLSLDNGKQIPERFLQQRQAASAAAAAKKVHAAAAQLRQEHQGVDQRLYSWHKSSMGREIGVDEYVSKAQQLGRELVVSTAELDEMWIAGFFKRHDIQKTVPMDKVEKSGAEASKRKKSLNGSDAKKKKIDKPTSSRKSGGGKLLAAAVTPSTAAASPSVAPSSAAATPPDVNSTYQSDDEVEYEEVNVDAAPLPESNRLHSSRFTAVNKSKHRIAKHLNGHGVRVISRAEARTHLERLIEFEKWHGDDPQVTFFYSQRLEALKEPAESNSSHTRQHSMDSTTDTRPATPTPPQIKLPPILPAAPPILSEQLAVAKEQEVPRDEEKPVEQAVADTAAA